MGSWYDVDMNLLFLLFALHYGKILWLCLLIKYSLIAVKLAEEVPIKEVLELKFDFLIFTSLPLLLHAMTSGAMDRPRE